MTDKTPKTDTRYFWDAYAKLVAANLAARKRQPRKDKSAWLPQ